MVGLVAWGTAAMRTQGDDVAEILALLGVRPTWHPESRRVTGVEVVSLEELGRPRIDVTVRISGFFRDAFPHLVALIDDAVATVAGLDEPEDENFVAAHARADAERLASCLTARRPGAARRARLRLQARHIRRRPHAAARDARLARRRRPRRGPRGVGRLRLRPRPRRRAGADPMRDCYARIDVAAKNVDSREHDILDSDDYYQYHGGMVATVRAITGRSPPPISATAPIRRGSSPARWPRRPGASSAPASPTRAGSRR